MSTPKFTPGPWYAVNQHVVSKQTMDGVARAYGRGPNSWDEAYANVSLISAAPELYEALVELVTEYESTVDGEYSGTELLAEMLEPAVRARAALAKARGEA